ncbi:hypothetical protein LINGRAHAP2_LOCUS13701 [Linum grandiflorum]
MLILSTTLAKGRSLRSVVSNLNSTTIFQMILCQIVMILTFYFGGG